jgi:hypothetical protein
VPLDGFASPSRLLARAKSTTRHVAKFLFEADLGTGYCVFDGAHGWEPVDPGESMSWNAPAAWDFITQF